MPKILTIKEVELRILNKVVYDEDYDIRFRINNVAIDGLRIQASGYGQDEEGDDFMIIWDFVLDTLDIGYIGDHKYKIERCE